MMQDNIKNHLQDSYLMCRAAISLGADKGSTQRRFEETVSSFLPSKDTWRPTHITRSALKLLSDSSVHYVEANKQIQRAHGLILGRLDRRDRTLSILTGGELKFDKWFSFYLENDKTVLVLKKENKSNTKMSISEVIDLPSWSTNLFECGSKSVKIRSKIEKVWAETNVNLLENC